MTKPFAALCLLRLVARGQVELDAPVARYWAEVAANGKESAPVRQALAHQAGLLALREAKEPSAIFDWARVADRLAREAPWWTPGAAHGEHAYFYGHFLGEILRRVDGRSLGRFLRDEIGDPLGVDLHVGLGPDGERRCAEVEGMDEAWLEANGVAPGSLYAIALDNPPGVLHPDVVNGRDWRRAEIPAVNGHGSARGVTRVYAALAEGGSLEGVELLPAPLAREMRTVQSSGGDRLLGRPVDWGLGVQIEPDDFGMGGIGGALGFGDAKRRIGFGYAMRRLADHERALRCLSAVEAATKEAASSS